MVGGVCVRVMRSARAPRPLPLPLPALPVSSPPSPLPPCGGISSIPSTHSATPPLARAGAAAGGARAGDAAAAATAHWRNFCSAGGRAADRPRRADFGALGPDGGARWRVKRIAPAWEEGGRAAARRNQASAPMSAKRACREAHVGPSPRSGSLPPEAPEPSNRVFRSDSIVLSAQNGNIYQITPHPTSHSGTSCSRTPTAPSSGPSSRRRETRR